MNGFTYKSRIALLFITLTQFSGDSLLIGSNANPHVDAWLDLKAGMFIHFNMSTFTGKSWSTGEEDPALFNPTDLDVNSWAKAAKSGGLKYGVLTVKHIDGFALWNTKISKHDVASSPYRKDIVKEYTDAFRKNKLKVGLYYAIWDRRWDRDSSIDQVDAIKVQMKELLDGKYGTIDMLWLDGWGWRKRYSEIPYQEIREYIREISPTTVVLNNDHENSLQTTDVLVWETAVKMPVPINSQGPFEVAEQIGRTWFYREGTVSNNKPKEYFQWIVNQVVPEGGVLTFNVGPDKSGAIPKERFTALKHIKEALKKGPITNWARSATATQSSTAHGNGPSIATDGKVFSLISGSVTNTNSEKEAWWEADLGASREIGEVRIWNRLKNGRDRLRDFYVFVSTEPLESKSLSETIAQPGVKAYYHEGIADWATSFPHLGEGRHIRIQLTGEESLSLAEVQVLDNTEMWKKPSYTKHPKDQTVVEGSDANFEVEISGYPAPEIRWFRQDGRAWTPISGENSTELQIRNAGALDAGNYKVEIENSLAVVGSKTFDLDVLIPPRILQLPDEIYVETGRTQNLMIEASGTEKLSYEWFCNGKSIGKTSSGKLTLRKVNTDKDEGSYHVQITNKAGIVNSESFEVTVLDPVLVDTPPQNKTAATGSSVTLEVAVSGGGEILYQWQKYDEEANLWLTIEDESSQSLTITEFATGDTGKYRALVSNPVSVAISKLAVLEKMMPPSIKKGPVSLGINQGKNFELKVQVNGSAPLLYKWQKNINEEWVSQKAGTEAFMEIEDAEISDGGEFRVVASNDEGSITSNVVSVEVYHAPSLKNEITELELIEGTASQIDLEVEALDKNGNIVKCNWYKDGRLLRDGKGLSGTKTPTVSITSVSLEDAGTYTCKLSNAVGTLQIEPIQVSVFEKPRVTSEFRDLYSLSGENVKFVAEVTGGEPLQYQWFFEGEILANESTTNLDIANVDQDDDGTYVLKVSNAAGSEEIIWKLFIKSEQGNGQAGPGLGNLHYGEEELFRVASRIHTHNGIPMDAPKNAYGMNLMYMLNGYGFGVFTPDSGRGPGGFLFYDLSDPRNPVMVNRFYEKEGSTGEFREAHSMGFGRYGSTFVVAIQSAFGVEFWDMSDVHHPFRLSKLRLPGVEAGGYFNSAWQISWQAPFLYVGGANNGLYIVNAEDPSAPFLIDRGQGKPNPIPTSKLGGFNIGPIFAFGNRLVISGIQTEQGFSSLDISDPINPVLQHVTPNAPVKYYSSSFNGKYLALSTYTESDPLALYDAEDPSSFSLVNGVHHVGKTIYGSFQDQYLFHGREDEIVKIDISDPQNFVDMGRGTLNVRAPDHGQVVPFGNLLYVGNDHGTGNGFIIHDSAPDQRPPAIITTHPIAESTNLAPTTRIGIAFSDNVQLSSLNKETFIVRKPGETPLNGRYSVHLGIANFAPEEELESNQTYIVEVPAGGVLDWVGNPIAEDLTFRFSTGSEVKSLNLDFQEYSEPEQTGQAITYEALGITDLQGDSVEYHWNFGDGRQLDWSTSHGTVTHTFEKPGHYQVVLRVRDSDEEIHQTLLQTIHWPKSVNQPTSSSTIVRNGSLVFNANIDNASVTAIDTITLKKKWETEVGAEPRTLAVSGEGNLWVVCRGDSEVHVLKAENGKVLASYKLPRASLPHGIVFSPNKSNAYVISEGSAELFKLDSSGLITGRLELGGTPHGIAISHDSATAYVTDFITKDRNATIHVVDLTSFTKTDTINLREDTTTVDAENESRGVPNYLASITISPDGKHAWVPSNKLNLGRGMLRDGRVLDFESTVRPILSKIDLEKSQELFEDQLDLDDRSQPNAIAFSPLGDYVYVSIQGSNAVEIRDAYDGSRVHAVENEGKAPRGLVLNSEGNRLFVHNFLSRTVTVHDVSGLVDQTLGSVSLLASIPTVEKERLPANILKGKQIFYNANDKRMSRDGYISCASCHQDGGQDGQVWDFTDRGNGLRNTLPLEGRFGLGHGNLHWTANFDEIQDFENDIRSSFGGNGFLSEEDFELTKDSLGVPKRGRSEELDALAAFVASHRITPKSPHRQEDGNLTESAKKGSELFKQLNCATCHSGYFMTDGQLHDVGTIRPSSGKDQGSNLTGIETPTLLGLWKTAPYLHDGSAPDLNLLFQEKNHGETKSLNKSERSDLVNFLKQIEYEGPVLPASFPEKVYTEKPAFIEHPTSKQSALGGSITFSIKPSGYPKPTISWQKQEDRKWITIPEAQGENLLLQNLTTTDSGNYRSSLTNALSTTFSKTAKLEVLGKPTFASEPTDQSFLVGKTGNVYVYVSGSKPLSFEWFKDGESIATTTSNKLSLRKMKASQHDGTYSVKVSNPVGEVTSEDFQVSVIEPVKIDVSPEDAGIVSGEAGSLTVHASGGGTLSYQWVKYDAKSRKWSNVEGATSATFDITAITEAEEGKYKCLVSNGPSTYYSKDADLMMYVPPTIKTQPRAVSQKEAGKVTLRVEALGTPLPTYQWRKLAGDGTTWENVPKANKSTLYFSKIKKEQAGKYRLRATNAGGHIDSDAVDIVVYYAPVLTTNIASKSSVNEAESLTLTVAADVLDSKGTNATYTWFKDKKALKDGGTVSGSKSATLTITGATGTDSGSYWCEIKNGVGTTKSASSKLTVLLKPNTSKPLKSLDLAEGKNATFSASIKGGKPMTYQWFKNDAEISGQTKNKLSLRGVTTSQAGTYKLLATNPAGAFEMEATLAVTAASTYVAPVANDLPEDSPARILNQALGANPTTGQTYQPIIDTVEDGDGTTYVSFSYTENNDAEGMQYILEGSADLNTWSPVDLSQASVNRLDRGNFTEVTVYVPASGAGGFFRIRIEQ